MTPRDDSQFDRDFEQFVGDLLPRRVLTVDETVDMLEKTRAWLDARRVPPERTAVYVASLVAAIEQAGLDLTAAEHEDMYRRWAEVFGVDIDVFKEMIH